MKLSERRTRMLHNLGLTWLKPPQALAVAQAPAASASPARSAAPTNAPLRPAVSGQNVNASAPASVPKPSAAPIFKPNSTSVPEFITSVAPVLGVIPDTVAQSDESALREQVAACQACGLCKSRRNTVFGEGAANPRVLVLGEAPGENEDAHGRPFVGQAGQLLDHMLHAIGLSREAEKAGAEQVFITNTLKCRPPANRNPEPGELAACDGFLLRQIQLLKPKVILALGRFAITQTLRDPALNAQPVGKLRGKVYSATLAGETVQVIVSYHPSYLLRSPAEKARAWEDLVLLADTLESLPKKP